MFRLIYLLLICLISIQLTSQALLAQNDNAQEIWQNVSETDMPTLGERMIIPQRYRTLKADISGLEELLDSAPLEKTTGHIVLTIPMADGTSQEFQIVNSPIMASELAAKYPEIQTYGGQGIDDRSATIRLDVTPFGFHGMIISAHGTTYLDPYARGNREYYISYDKRDFFTHKRREESLPEDAGFDRLQELASSRASALANGDMLRTYRTAIACTGEYATFHGGTKASALAAINTTLNRVNGIYIREFAVRMELIANNEDVIYLDANTDPYDNNDAGSMLGDNQTTIDMEIGTLNYDMGHVFSTGAGGVASLASVCRLTRKARGVTGISQPQGDPFDVDYVAHEMGHQFGGNHTFNSDQGSCGGNRTANSAYEPGSATTIMGYAGLCGSDNVQFSSDDYFHVRSYDQVVTNITTGQGSLCGTVTANGNTVPVVSAGAGGKTIPISTPFELEGLAQDVDGNLITYCWEEYDLGPAGRHDNPSGNAPIFRSFAPTITPIRIFPQISDIVNNTTTIGEILPSYGRFMDFRFTARDNNVGGGGVDFAPYSLTVSDLAGPFLVSYPNDANITLDIDSLTTMTWDVANTNGVPVNTLTVDIFLSVDGGFTYPIVLAENVPNTGSAPVLIPDTVTNRARVKIKGRNNVFFDISNNNFSIVDKNVSIDQETLGAEVNLLENPVDGELVLEITLSNPQDVKLEVIDFHGRVVATKEVISLSKQQETLMLSVSHLTPGLYFYRLSGEKLIKSEKIIIR